MDTAPSTEKMLSRRDGVIGHIIFNNPERHNAVSLDMWDAVEEILTEFEADQDVRVLVLSGAGGKSFVSGADISKFDKERGSAEAVAHYNARIKIVYDRIVHFPKPTIAMINGYCIGGGLNLATVCDLRFCSAKSKFGMPAAKLALGYPFHSIQRLVSVVGAPAAKDLMFSARHIDAEEAFRTGLVHKLLPEDELETYVADYATQIGANAPLTLKSMKFIVGEVLKDPDARDLAACEDMVTACFSSEDYVEGRTAFMEKRKPVFRGR
jgi:enoyl-CoA hydratase/carnithine racemase